jgi:hypothetical protein
MSQVSSGILGVGNGSVGDFSATLQATSVSLAQGSAASPSLFFTGFTTGLYSSNSHAGITYVNSSTNYFSVVQGSATVPSIGTFAFSSTADSTHAGDSGISRLGAASLAVGNGTAGDKTGSITLANLILSATQSPASNAAGTAGQLAYDGSYIYICIASGNWRRVATTGGY